ncbi:MAG: G5 domain-containing protein [Bacillota bacterium]
MRNTTPGHLLIKTEAEGGRVTFRLYGDLPSGQAVRIESQVTGSLPFPTREVPDPTLLPDQRQQVRGGIPGLTSEAYRLLFVDGKLIRRELLSRDRYLPVAAVIRTGAPAERANGGSD